MEQKIIGSILKDRYRLDAEIGQGGMGVVFRGFDLELEREVAVKILKADVYGEKERGRFIHEAKVIAKLKHPNIVEIYDVGEFKGAPFFVMELVDGISLKYIQSTNLDDILELFEQICQCLENAHQNGIVHRDLKPENVLIDHEGRVKLADFGIAHSEVSDFTTAGEIIGTVNYLAPELVKGEPVDGRTDLYSLGVMLYELTTGRLPFTADNPAAVLTKHLFEKPLPINQLNPELPAGLNYLTNKLLSKSPDERPSSAAEVQQMLRSCRADQTGTLDIHGYPSLDGGKMAPAFIENLPVGEVIDEVFVGRKREIARLQEYLDKARSGTGQIVFVKGGPGRGKTALVQTFVRQAQSEYEDLLVTWGTCNAFSGIGDAYLPFREIFAMLSGDIKTRQKSGSITRMQAKRLWGSFPILVEALLSRGNNLVNTFIPGEMLLSQAAVAFPERIDLLGKLAMLAEQRSDPGGKLEQNMLFEQCVNVLDRLSQTKTLILILDDLQWVDSASVSLLFYLGRRMTGNRILILGTYRPSEVVQGRAGEVHPLNTYLAETKRLYGEMEIDLGVMDEAESREFIDELIDSEPNLLDEEFRRRIYMQTQGHPLFTVEVLRTLQDQAKIVKDDRGRWMQDSSLEWEMIPARVEGVIEERIGRLDDDLKEILEVASVEGQDFTAQIVARVQEKKERVILGQLSGDLDRRFRLVRERGEERRNGNLLTHYYFSHHLYQLYFYNHLGIGQRRLLHREIGQAIEDLYVKLNDQTESLAYHFLLAEHWEKAYTYQLAAGKQAFNRFACKEAIAFLRHALDITKQLPDLELGDQVEIHSLIADVLRSTNEYDEAMAELAIALSLISTSLPTPANRLRQASIYHQMGQVLRNEGKYAEAVEVIQQGIDSLIDEQPGIRGALQIAMASALTRQGELGPAQSWCEEGMLNAEKGGDLAELAHAFSLLGTIRRDLGDTAASLEHRLKSLAISEEIANIPLQMEAHNNLAVAYYDLGQLEKAVYHYNQSRDLSQRIGNLNTAARAEINLGEVQLIRGDWDAAERAFSQALKIWESTGYLLGQAYGSCNMGAVLTRKGDFKEAIVYLERSEQLFSDIGAHSFLPSVHRSQADAYLGMGKLDIAEKLVHSAIAQARELSMSQEEGSALRIQGVISREKGELSQAEESLEQSTRIFSAAGLQYEEALSNYELAVTWSRAGKLELAESSLEKALRTFDQLNASHDLALANELKSVLKL
ncbi:MAG: tetratricopeptide repeat protein [Chloroflexota bacterium]|nr:MAG: tetratricopeptide repeat protein [Chloroflexota bacterium]